MDVCIFSNLHANKPQKTSLEKIVHIIQTSHHLQKLTFEARPDLANRIYIAVYKSISARFRELLQLPTDQQAAHAEHLCLVSFGSQAYFNPLSVSIEYKYDTQRLGKYSKGLIEYHPA